MDEYSGKKGSDGLFVSRKGSNLVLRDTPNNRDHNSRFCNRIGCNGRMNTVKSTQTNFQEKAKSSRTSFRTSSNGKELVGSSSRTSSLPTNPRKPFPGPRKKLESSLPDYAGTSENRSTEVGSSSVPNTRSSRSFYRKSGNGKSDFTAESSISLAAKNATQPTRTGLKATVKRRICEGESSNSARGKKISGSQFEGKNNPSSSAGISISDSRRTRSGSTSPNQDNAIKPVNTRRSFRSRVSNQVGRNSTSENEPRAVNPQASMESPSSRSRSYDLPRIRQSSPELPRGSIRSSINRESFRRYNMDGIAEMLLALERIEQDEELSYEQLLALESGLFLNGLNFYDQHRDMRLDIDNMSYEELLALEEEMGSVSTALTEEALSTCVRSSIYDSTSLKDTTLDLCGEKDDVKCSVCQEEYRDGDEVGRLRCEHKYHVSCIHQWLRLKNWCPICKAPASSL